MEYDPGTGRRQNVHTKQWSGEQATEQRQRVQQNLQNAELQQQEKSGKIATKDADQLDNDVFRIGSYQEKVALKGSAEAESDWKNAKEEGRHSGVYQDAMKKSKKQLQKSIASHTDQVELHAEKIAHPEQYDVGWNSKTPQQQEGLLKKWRKDMERNAQQANIEIYVWKERF